MKINNLINCYLLSIHHNSTIIEPSSDFAITGTATLPPFPRLEVTDLVKIKD
jgi:hypothetical protein